MSDLEFVFEPIADETGAGTAAGPKGRGDDYIDGGSGNDFIENDEDDVLIVFDGDQIVLTDRDAEPDGWGNDLLHADDDHDASLWIWTTREETSEGQDGEAGDGRVEDGATYDDAPEEDLVIQPEVQFDADLFI